MLLTLALAGFAMGARAVTISEAPDAGDLPHTAQSTTGIGAVDTITGSITNASDVDMYRIHITDPALFTATVSDFPADSTLWLFDRDGNFLASNDDSATLLSHIGYDYANWPELAEGDYFLAVTGLGNEPRDGGDAPLSVDVGAGYNGLPNGAGPLAAWVHVDDDQEGDYTITLTGASFSSASPEIGVQQPAGNYLGNGMATVDFGFTAVLSGASDKTFIIDNAGEADLVIGMPTIAGADASQFSVVAEPTSPVYWLGGATTLTVRFQPTSPGVKTATLSIANDDAEESPFTVVLEGTALAVQSTAMSFTGTNDYAVANDFASLPVGNSSRTIEFWVKLAPEFETGTAVLWGNFSQLQGINGVMIFNNGGGYAMPYFRGHYADATSSLTFPMDSWAHIAYVYDATTSMMRSYVNGVPGDVTEGITLNTVSTPLYLGLPVPEETDPFHGEIDEVRIWNIARSAGEIAANMNTELSGAENGLVAYYKMDDTSHPGADCSPLSNVLCLNGPTLTNDSPVIVDAPCAGGTPDVSVFGNSVAITPGDLSPDSADGTDFGGVPVGSGTNTQTFTIQNTGGGILRVSGIDSTNSQFVVSGITLPVELAEGGSTNFDVTFTPNSAGIKSTLVAVTIANVCEKNPYRFAIQGTGVGANTLPMLTTPPNVTAEATGPAGATVTFSVVASDEEDGALIPIVTPPSGSLFAVGSTLVTAIATDSNDASVTNTFMVNVNDTIPPTIALPADITVIATSPSGAIVTFSVTATDIVDGAVSPFAVPASGSTFARGSNNVVVTATDAHGNIRTASFNVFVLNAAPVVGALSDHTVNPGGTVSFNATATDADGDALTFSLLSPPDNASIGSGGAFTWRPHVNQSQSTNIITVVVTDNGTPNLSATNSFNVIVNPLAPVVLTSLGFDTNGHHLVAVEGTTGPDYVIQTTTELPLDGTAVWVDLSTNLAPAAPFVFDDASADYGTNRFYRIRLQP